MHARRLILFLCVALLLCQSLHCTAIRVELAGLEAAARYGGPKRQLYPSHLPFRCHRDSAGAALTPGR